MGESTALTSVERCFTTFDRHYVYEYPDRADRLVVSRKGRGASKDFATFSVDKAGTLRMGKRSLPNVLYNLDEVLATSPGDEIWLCEGEDEVERLLALGVVATTNPYGGESWDPAYNEFFRDRCVVVSRHKDATGRKRAALLMQNLAPIVSRLLFVEASVGAPDSGADIGDHLDAGLSLPDLIAVQPDICEQLSAERHQCPGTQPPRTHMPSHAPGLAPGHEARRRRYGAPALADECRIIENAPKGNQNNQLLRSAGRLLTLVEGGCLDREATKDALKASALVTQLKPAEVRATIKSAEEWAKGRPRGPAEDRARPDPGVRRRLESQIDRITQLNLPGDAKVSLFKVALGLLSLARALGDCSRLFPGNRRLAQLAGVARRTVDNYVVVLTEAGIIELMAEHEGRNARVWRLHLDRLESMPDEALHELALNDRCRSRLLSSSRPQLCLSRKEGRETAVLSTEAGLQGLDARVLRHDAFRRGGYGANGLRVFLTANDMTADDVARRLGLSQRTVRRHIKNMLVDGVLMLNNSGKAQRIEKVELLNALDGAAKRLGTEGVGTQQQERFAAERAEYAKYLSWLEAQDDAQRDARAEARTATIFLFKSRRWRTFRQATHRHVA